MPSPTTTGSFGGPAGPASVPQWSPTGEKSGKRKKIIISTAAIAALLLGGAGFVFGYYIPNKPENVWKTGLSRTGQEFDALVEKLSDPATFETLNKNKVSITGSGEINGDKFDLSMDSVYDQTKSDSSINVGAEIKDRPEDGYDVNVKVKTDAVEGSVWPNVYFNISGLSSFGLDSYLPGLLEYEGKWISVEQDFYDQFLDDGDDSEAEEQKNLTQQDMVSILKDVNEVTKEYVFTEDTNKSIFVMGQFVGTEDSEGIKANRYKATIHEANATNYCKALVDKIYANETYRKIYPVDEANLSKEIEDQKKSCEPVEKDEKTYPSYKEEFDIWIDKKYKMLHKVRLTTDLEGRTSYYNKKKTECMANYSQYDFEDSDSFCDYYDDLIETGESYEEVGQIYSGDNQIKLFMNSKKDTDKNKSGARADLNIQLEGLLIDGKVVYSSDTEDNKSNIEVNIKTEPYSGEVDANKPEGAIPLMDVYRKLFETPSQPGAQSLGAETDGQEEPNDMMQAPNVLKNLFVDVL